MMRSYWQDWDSNPMFLTPARHTLPGPAGWVRVQNFIGASFLGRLSLVLNSPPPIWVRFILGTLSEASSLWWPAETQTLPRLFFLRPPHKPGEPVMVPRRRGRAGEAAPGAWGTDRPTAQPRGPFQLSPLRRGFVPSLSELCVLCLRRGVTDVG